jgi:cytochrome P450
VQICRPDELVLFVVAGHETIATALTYALFALGRRPDLQRRVAAEADELGEGRPPEVQFAARRCGYVTP